MKTRRMAERTSWLRVAMPKHGLVVAGAVALGMSLMTQGACSMTRNECAPGPPSCLGPTTVRECLTGEGNTSVNDVECPAEQQCVATPSGARCEGGSEGAACASDSGCRSDLRCEGTCRAPAAEVRARCEAGTRVVVPDDGSEVVVDVPLQTSSATANAIARPACATTPLPPVAAEGFARVTLARIDAIVEVSFASSREDFPQGIQFSEIACEALYGRRIPCNMQQEGDAPIGIDVRCGRELPLLFYTTQIRQSEPTVRVRFKKRSDLSSVGCQADGGAG